MSYCSRSRRRRLTVSDIKVEHIVSFTSVFTSVRFADHDFLLKCKISAIWRRFPLIFAFYMLNVCHISTSGLFDQTDRASISHALSPTSIIPTKFEVDMTIRGRVIAFLSTDTSRDLVTLTFDLEQLSYMAGHVTNLATKYEDPMLIRS